LAAEIGQQHTDNSHGPGLLKKDYQQQRQRKMKDQRVELLGEFDTTQVKNEKLDSDGSCSEKDQVAQAVIFKINTRKTCG
jgi:hypothetical protein